MKNDSVSGKSASSITIKADDDVFFIHVSLNDGNHMANIINIPKDGDCFFTCLAVAIYKVQNRQKVVEIRKRIADYVKYCILAA